MGCWNETCLLTNLPIKRGEEIYLAVIMKTPFWSNRCYAACDWVPLIMLSGRYDDYGSVEDIELLDDADVWLNAIKNMNGKMIDKRTNQMIDTSEWNTMYDFLNSVLDGLFVKSPIKSDLEILPLSLVCIKKVFLDEMFSCLESEYPETHQYIEKQIQRYSSSREAALRDINLCANKKNSERDIMNMVYLFQDFSLHELMKTVSDGQITGYWTQMFRCVEEMKIEALFFMVKRMSRTTQILQILRKSWHRPSGAGSQAEYEHMTKKLTESMSKIIIQS